MSQSSEKRALDLVIDGHDISHYIGDWATCQETRAEWTVHTELILNQDTSGILQTLTDREVWLTYRMRSEAGVGPWRSGRAAVTWRLNETGNEELILHGIGRLDMAKPTTKSTGAAL